MRFTVALLIFFAVIPLAHADNIGVFTVADGVVRIWRDQHYLVATSGVEVIGDDIVETDKGASAQLDMEDGSVLRLGPQTRVALTSYQLDKDKSVVSASLDVLSGWLRFAVAKLKPVGSYRLQTPSMTIGVRGTEGTINADNEQSGLDLHEGLVDVVALGDNADKFQPMRIGAGEFIQRRRDQALTRSTQPPAGFRNQLPPMLRQKLTRRAQLLKQRGVPPKIIRKITREDAKLLLEHHPRMNEKWRQRLREINDTSKRTHAKNNRPTPEQRRQRLQDRRNADER